VADLQEQLQLSLGAAYQIERELGGGGMSRVFLALEKSLGRRVVVKVLLPELAAGVSVERFRREIQLAAQLQHPHIVPLLAAGESEGLPYFTMPFVSGESLRARLIREGELPVAEAVRVLRDVASGLAYAHGQGVVHRDIKPDNVLLSHGVAVVTDFGVAKALRVSAGLESLSDRPGLTSLGISLGTPAYMAARAGHQRPGDGLPGGHLRLRGDGVRDVSRAAAVQRALAAGGPRRAPDRGAGADRTTAPRHTAGARLSHHEDIGEARGGGPRRRPRSSRHWTPSRLPPAAP